MTTPNNQEHTDFDALRSLNTIQPPAGMQDRITQNITERARQQQFNPVARGLKRYAWELWVGASIALAATAVICIFALQSHRTPSQPEVALIPAHKIIPTPISTPVARTSTPLHKATRIYQTQKEEPVAVIPHTPPPQPLTSQERLLLTLANSPSLAAGVSQSQTVSQHGLGANALFELDHEQLQPMRAESKLLQPLPPLPHNLP